MSEIRFIKKPIKDAEHLAKLFSNKENYKRLHITSEQRHFIDDLARMLIAFLPMKEMAMRGFIIRAATNWQMKNRKRVSESANWGSKEKLNFGMELMSTIFTELTRTLVQPEQECELELVLAEAIEMYNTTFCSD
jgi:hypothetical protein